MEKTSRVLLVGGGVIRRLVHHQRGGTAAVEEVHRDTHAASIVGGGEHAVEVLEQVDIGPVVLLAHSEDSRHS